MAAERGSETSILVCQVRSAKAEHKMDETNFLLRSKHFPSASKVVYLGNITSTLISLLENPETPTFTTPPTYNEQKWTMETTSGQLKITITSDSYWGFGLFNSGYLNTIILEGPIHLRSRVVYDLTSSLPYKPWEFKHLSSARRWVKRKFPDLDEKKNQKNWSELIDYSNQKFKEIIQVMKEATEKVTQTVKNTQSTEFWNKEKAEVSLAAAEFDLELAKGALADYNAPAVERAIARIEASLIEANPETGVHDNENKEDLEKQQIIISEITIDNEKVSDIDINSINQIDSTSLEEELPLIDLTIESEQE
jgi:hypothetical protein